nr:hypothetical protein [Sphingomonas lenta]
MIASDPEPGVGVHALNIAHVVSAAARQPVRAGIAREHVVERRADQDLDAVEPVLIGLDHALTKPQIAL